MLFFLHPLQFTSIKASEFLYSDVDSSAFTMPTTDFMCVEAGRCFKRCDISELTNWREELRDYSGVECPTLDCHKLESGQKDIAFLGQLENSTSRGMHTLMDNERRNILTILNWEIEQVVRCAELALDKIVSVQEDITWRMILPLIHCASVSTPKTYLRSACHGPAMPEGMMLPRKRIQSNSMVRELRARKSLPGRIPV